MPERGPTPNINAIVNTIYADGPAVPTDGTIKLIASVVEARDEHWRDWCVSQDSSLGALHQQIVALEAVLAETEEHWKRTTDALLRAKERVIALEAALARAEKYAKALEMLAEGQEKLLVAYRLGAGPQTARTAIKGADMVREAQERLALLARGAEGDGDA